LEGKEEEEGEEEGEEEDPSCQRLGVKFCISICTFVPSVCVL